MQDLARRHEIEDKIAVICIDILLLLYIGMGLYGSIWSSDDFDGIKMFAYGYVGVPLTILFIGLRLLYPRWGRRFPKLFYSALITIGLLFIPGHLLLVNALTADQAELKRDIKSGSRVVTVDVKRGGLGVLHRTRW